MTPDTLTEIAFADADHVVGYDTQSTGCGLTRLALQDDGLQPIVNLGAQRLVYRPGYRAVQRSLYPSARISVEEIEPQRYTSPPGTSPPTPRDRSRRRTARASRPRTWSSTWRSGTACSRTEASCARNVRPLTGYQRDGKARTSTSRPASART
jgi:hypothetical protein